MLFDVFFNNILVISWHSVLLMEETDVSGENHRPAASHRQIVLHKVASRAPRHLRIRINKFTDDRQLIPKIVFR
jgi:hypothetical protein